MPGRTSAECLECQKSSHFTSEGWTASPTFTLFIGYQKRISYWRHFIFSMHRMRLPSCVLVTQSLLIRIGQKVFIKFLKPQLCKSQLYINALYCFFRNSSFTGLLYKRTLHIAFGYQWSNESICNLFYENIRQRLREHLWEEKAEDVCMMLQARKWYRVHAAFNLTINPQKKDNMMLFN